MRLLESNARRRRGRIGTMASVLVHAALIGGAVVGTASAGIVSDLDGPREKTIFYAPPPEPAPAPPTVASRPRTGPTLSSVPPMRAPTVPPDIVGPIIPGYQILPGPDPLRGLTESFDRGLAVAGSGTPSGAPSGDAPWDASFVDRAAAPLGQVRPHYPETLRSAGLGGRAAVRFVVDSLGRIEAGTVRLVAATHPAFGDAALRAVNGLRFRPAEAGGRRVRQLVELPFEFVIE